MFLQEEGYNDSRKESVINTYKKEMPGSHTSHACT